MCKILNQTEVTLFCLHALGPDTLLLLQHLTSFFLNLIHWNEIFVVPVSWGKDDGGIQELVDGGQQLPP